MSDNNQSNSSAENVAEDQGFSPEPSAAPTSASASRKADADVRRRNLRATFGSGPGKLGLIAAAVVIAVFGVLAVTNMRDAPVVASKAQVDAPTSPPNRVSTNAVTPEEAARRAEQSRKEAEAVQAQGGSYQPGFDYNIGASAKQGAPESNAKFAGFDTPDEQSARAQAQANSGRVLQTQALPSGTPAQQQQTPQQQAEQQRRDQEMQRAAAKLEVDQKQAEGERDKYVESITADIVKQIGGMFASQGNESLNNLGAYSQTTYYTAPARNAAGAGSSSFRNASRKPTIKAGSTMYATLDSEANTDDGRTVLATVRSGPWKGAKLIGLIEQSYNNISLSFSTLAPQDERSTIRIRAVALREEDAKLGMAEKIDHHTLSRYTALGAAALLQGAGRVYQQPVGTTVSTPGGIVTTNEMPRDRQVIGSAIGELGTSVGAEIRRRGFNQPSTYSTPAQTGFMLYFLEDVVPANPEDQQQQQQQPQQAQQHPTQQTAAVSAPAPAAAPQGGQGTYNPGYGTTPYGYAPGTAGGVPSGYQGGVPSGYQGYGNDNRYRGPLNSN